MGDLSIVFMYFFFEPPYSLGGAPPCGDGLNLPTKNGDALGMLEPKTLISGDIFHGEPGM